MEKTYNKLIRDKVPDSIEADGHIGHYEILDDIRFAEELKKKLVEESLEVANSQDRDSLVKELADLAEVSHTIMQRTGITSEEVEAERLSKLESKGGFEKQIYLTTVDEIENKGA